MNGCNQDRNCHKFQVKPTEQGPLPVGNEAADVAGVLLEHEVDLEPVVGPAPELHLAVLVVEGEPGDVDGTAGLEYPGRDVGAQSRAGHHHVRLVGGVEGLAGAVVHEDVRGPDDVGREPEVLHIPVFRLIPSV